MSKFWDQQNQPASNVQQALVDEQAAQELIESFNEQPIEQDVLEDEEADLQEVLSNANLRLEQGRLYQMIINHDIFENLDADPKAIRNVTREFRKFARERMEIMLGMRQATSEPQAVVISSPFNDLEVIALKTIAAQMSKGKTLNERADTSHVSPKKEAITPLSGSNKPSFAAPTLKPIANPLALQKHKKEVAKAPPIVATSAIKPPLDEPLLTKPISQMTPEELLEHDKKSAERRGKTQAELPPGYTGIPSQQELENLYNQRFSNMQSQPGNPAAALMSFLQRQK